MKFKLDKNGNKIPKLGTAYGLGIGLIVVNDGYEQEEESEPISSTINLNKENIMNKLYVKSNSIHVKHGQNDRILVVFPHPVCATRALAWCHKHNMNVLDGAISLLHHCTKRRIPTFGHEFDDTWGSLAGLKPHKVGIENLSPSK